MLIIDGLPSQSLMQSPLEQLKAYSLKHKLAIWFSVRTHRHEEPGPRGIPRQIMGLEYLFDVIIQLLPKGKEIQIKILKGHKDGQVSSSLLLDPATMLIEEST